MRRNVVHMLPLIALILALLGAAAKVPYGAADDPNQSGEWPSYAATSAGTKYSPLDQINKDTVKNLRIAWRQSVTPVEVRQGVNAPGPTNYQHTPLMVGGLVYMSTGYGTVAALNAKTGKVVWFDAPPGGMPRVSQPGGVIRHDDPRAAGLLITSGRGLPSRGLAYWTDGQDARVITVMGRSLVALNAKTGKRYADFGNGGQVDLTKGYERPADTFTYGSAPIVVRDVIVVGGIARGGGEVLPGDVRGFDVRTGAQLWTFHTIPRPG